MDAADFERVYQAFGEFHSFFAPLFGRRESRDHSRHYLHPVLVQAGDRRNAETLSGSVGVSVRAMQRFLTEAPWDDDPVMGRLQNYLGLRLEHPVAMWVLDGSDFPKQGRKSAGVARQYCSRLGKVANGASPGGQATVPAGELEQGPGALPGGGGARGRKRIPVRDGTGAGDAGAGLGAGWVHYRHMKETTGLGV